MERAVPTLVFHKKLNLLVKLVYTRADGSMQLQSMNFSFWLQSFDRSRGNRRVISQDDGGHYMIKNLFNEKKAAQAAAFFLFQAGQPVSVLKLTKLLYLAERRSFERHGSPMIGDRLVSMPHGPVLSVT